MKKTLSALMAAAVMLAAFSACSTGTPGNTPAPGNAPAESAAGSSEAASGLPRTITLSNGKSYPSGTVTFIAPFAAGGGVDMGIRLFTKYAQNYTDASLVVENITGGSGLVGIQNGLSRATDGSTLWHIDAGTQYVTTSNSVCPFDVLEDMSIVGNLVADDRVWVMSPNETRFTNAEEFFAYAKAHPGEISVATSGNATISGCSTIYMQQAVGMELNLISFGGSADAKAAFLGGHTDIMAAGVSEAQPMLMEGQGKIICSLTDGRIDVAGFEETPTLKEMGYDLISASTYRGLATSKDVDPAIVEYWTNIMQAVTSDPAFLSEAENLALSIHYLNSEEFTSLAEEMFALWYDIKEAAGL